MVWCQFHCLGNPNNKFLNSSVAIPNAFRTNYFEKDRGKRKSAVGDLNKSQVIHHGRAQSRLNTTGGETSSNLNTQAVREQLDDHEGFTDQELELLKKIEEAILLKTQNDEEAQKDALKRLLNLKKFLRYKGVTNANDFAKVFYEKLGIKNTEGIVNKHQRRQSHTQNMPKLNENEDLLNIDFNDIDDIISDILGIAPSETQSVAVSKKEVRFLI